MSKTAVGLYATSAEAQQVLNDLVAAGFARSNIRILLGDQSTRQLHEWYDDQPGVAGGAGWQGDAGTMLTSLGVPSADANFYEEALHRGDALVSVTTSDARIDEAVDIMSRYGILDIRERMRGWGAAATSGMESGIGAAAAAAGTDRTLRAGEEATLPVIEEEVRVGKREVETGGVRVRAHVTETPLQETVNLREEHVEVERRPVDRPVSGSDIDNLRDQTIEVRETAEEAVVEKQARVVEEVVVRKEADTHQERIDETVRRTDVEVEQIPGQALQGWDRYRSDFETHYTTAFANNGHEFSYYEPAYRYGYGLASTRPDWRGRSWEQIEADARRDWEARNQGPWEEFKDAVRHGWQRITT